MFIAQVSCATIIITWRIIRFTCLLIITTNVVLLILKWQRCFYYVFLINDTIHFCSFTLVVWFLNTFFSFDQSFWNLFLLILRGIRSLSGDTVVILDLCLDIIEEPRLSLLTFICFGCYILVLLSDKLADEIDLVFFSNITVSYVSVLLKALYLSNDFDLSNAVPLFDSLLIDLYFLLLDACGLSVLLNISILFVYLWWFIDVFTILRFVTILLIPSLPILSVAETNGLLEDMILVLNIF